MIEFPIENKFSNEVQFTAKIDCDESTPYSQKLGLAVKWAIENMGAYLSYANLTNAYLKDANLMDADLEGAYLYDANLKGANLKGADLTDAYRRGVDLTGANLNDFEDLFWVTKNKFSSIMSLMPPYENFFDSNLPEKYKNKGLANDYFEIDKRLRDLYLKIYKISTDQYEQES